MDKHNLRNLTKIIRRKIDGFALIYQSLNMNLFENAMNDFVRKFFTHTFPLFRNGIIEPK